MLIRQNVDRASLSRANQAHTCLTLALTQEGQRVAWQLAYGPLTFQFEFCQQNKGGHYL